MVPVVSRGCGSAHLLDLLSHPDWRGCLANRGRELRGLIAAPKLPGARSKRHLPVLTLIQRDKLGEEGHDITVLTAWGWLD